MTQNLPLPQNVQIYTARARIWLRGREWILGIVDKEVKQLLKQYIGQRVVIEVLPMVFVEARLRNDMGYPAAILPARLKQTWQTLWASKHARRPDLVVRVYIPAGTNQTETPAGGGA